MSEVRVITLWQPWASLIALGLKQYETRRWGTNYRGKLAIHAAKRPFVTEDGLKTLCKDAYRAWMQALELAYESGVINDQSRLPFSHQLPLGSILAISDLVDCREMVDVASRNCHLHPVLQIDSSIQTPLEKAVGDWAELRYAWKLENVVAVQDPIPLKGGQGLRVLRDAEVLKQLGLGHE